MKKSAVRSATAWRRWGKVCKGMMSKGAEEEEEEEDEVESQLCWSARTKPIT